MFDFQEEKNASLQSFFIDVLCFFSVCDLNSDLFRFSERENGVRSDSPPTQTPKSSFRPILDRWDTFQLVFAFFKAHKAKQLHKQAQISTFYAWEKKL